MKMKKYARISLAGALSLTVISLVGGGKAWATPMAPEASASSYGAEGATYLYGPLGDSSSTGPASVSTAAFDTGYGGALAAAYNGGIEADGYAYATPGGDLGVAATGTAPDGSPSHPYNFSLYDYTLDTAPVVDSYASFQNSAVVTSAINPLTGTPYLADGTPVQLQVSMRMDGSMSLGVMDQQWVQAADSPGGFTSSSDVSADFTLWDPAITYSGGEIDGIPINLIDFSADVYGENSGYTTYDANSNEVFVPEQNVNSSWSLTSNHGNNLGGDGSSVGLPVSPDGTLSGGDPNFLDLTFDTGKQTVTLDTYVGAELDWNGDMYAFNQAYGASATNYTDFSHTFGVNLNPATGNVYLDFSYPQQPLSTPAPEPCTMLLFGTGLLGLAGVRLRKAKGLMA